MTSRVGNFASERDGNDRKWRPCALGLSDIGVDCNADLVEQHVQPTFLCSMIHYSYARLPSVQFLTGTRQVIK